MPSVPITETTSPLELAAVRTPLQGTDIVFITIGELTYRGTLANVLAFIATDLSGYVTTASIVDVLTSTSAVVPLSAGKGKTLKDLIDALTTTVGAKLDASAYIQHAKGKYTTLLALQTAHPTAIDGDYAIVDAGTGSNAHHYIWDAQDGWVDSGNVVVGTTTDEITEGSTNKYFTDTRVRAAVLTGLSLVTNAVITASDTVLSALGKLQKQIADLISSRRYTFNKYTSSTHTLLLAELTPEGSVFVQMNNASANTVYCPTPTSLGVTIGDSCIVQQYGAGTTTLAAVPSGGGSGATFVGDLVFSGANKCKSVIADSSTSWLVVG